MRKTCFESSTVHSLQGLGAEKPHMDGVEDMSRLHEGPNCTFVQFLLDEAPRQKNSIYPYKRGAETKGYLCISDAALEKGVSRIRLYKLNERNCFRLDTMLDFVEDFGIDIDVFAEWLCARIKEGTYSRRKRVLISKVS